MDGQQQTKKKKRAVGGFLTEETRKRNRQISCYVFGHFLGVDGVCTHCDYQKVFVPNENQKK